MIPGNVVVNLKVDASRFVEMVTSVARSLTRLNVELELHGLEPHQVETLMFVRGSSHEYAEPDERDEYLRALLAHHELGCIAAGAFLRGWFTFREADARDRAHIAWHRWIGSTAVQVSA